MLRRLYISNYALITELEIRFDEGLSIITGETGAGKSIILGALSLLLGGRADSRVVSDKDAKSVVEAAFKPRADVREIFADNDIDWDSEEMIIRREISSNGRSRAFVNDTPVNLKTLADIASRHIDIHSQNRNIMLAEPRTRLEIIDSVADNAALRKDYSETFRTFVRERNRLRTLREQIANARENEDFLRFRLSALDALKPRRGELRALEKEQELLSDAGETTLRLDEASSLLNAPESGITASLAKVRQLLAKVNMQLLESESEETPGLMQRLESAAVEMDDIAATVESLAESIDNDPSRLEKIEKRISDLYDALHRFKVQTDDELVDLHESLQKQLANTGAAETDIEELSQHVVELGRLVKEKAELLSESRRSACEVFTKMLIERTAPLGMPNIRFSAAAAKSKIGADGQDEIMFLCSFNKNREMTDMAAVASGGETSRVMLAIKSIIAEHLELPTIIFDEVDTGVSGEIADRMGAMMGDMARGLQVIAITHLPQVAARGERQYVVYKTDENDKTVTRIRLLDEHEREEAIAAMLSGADVDEAALLNARSLLKRAQRH